MARPQTEPARALADYIAPPGHPDWLALFAVTAGQGIEDLARAAEKAGDDYRSIMLKALADRLAEAFAERLHERCAASWGYVPDETLSNDDMIAENYQGIRPAPATPPAPITPRSARSSACSTPKPPPACTSPKAAPWSRYFTVDRLTKDQIESYAHRKGIPLAVVERWLGPNLGYEA
jgi:5-methyltetrahydrofolate--homocysteine methyltransferase